VSGHPEQVRPFGFLTIAHPTLTETLRVGGSRCLIAPYEKDPTVRMRKAWWFDRHHPDTEGYQIRTTDPIDHVDRVIAVKPYGTYYEDYRHHREAEAADIEGKPCHPWTRGLLQPRTLRATGLVRVGKEANRLAESPDLVLDDTDRAIAYPESAHVITAADPHRTPTPLVHRHLPQTISPQGHRLMSLIVKIVSAWLPSPPSRACEECGTSVARRRSDTRYCPTPAACATIAANNDHPTSARTSASPRPAPSAAPASPATEPSTAESPAETRRGESP